MKNNTTIRTTLNIRYTGKNWLLSSNQIDETLQLSRHPQGHNPDFHHNPVTSEPKNITRRVDGVRRIHENTGLRIILGWILKQLHETGHSSLQPYNGFKSLENSHSKILCLAYIKNLILSYEMMLSFNFFYTEIICVFF